MPKPKGMTTTSDVIKILGIAKKTLYLWEAAKKIPAARRDLMNGYRFYTEGDIKRLKRITGRGK